KAMSSNKRRLSKDITGEPKKTKHDVHSQQDDEVLYDSGYFGSQGSDAYLTGFLIHENSSQEYYVELMEIDEDTQEGNSSSLSTEATGSNREFCENHLCFAINIGTNYASQQKKKKKEMKKEGKESGNEESDIQSENILRMCNALLNSGGGVLEMKISNSQNSSTSQKDPVDSFWQTIEEQLRRMIRPSRYDDVFDRSVLSDRILLFINAPNHFCTMKYNLFVPGDAGVYEATYDDVVNFLKFEGCKKDLNSYIRQRFTIARQLSAFGNCDGGVLLIGVGDDRRVSGVDSKEYVEERVISLFTENICYNFELKRGIHWDLTFSDVSGSESKSVIVIKMAGIRDSGGIFAKCPESYELRCDINGQQVPHLVAFDKWKERMKPDDADLPRNTKVMEDMLKRFRRMHISNGHLLTVKGDVQRIRDAFFTVDEKFSISPSGIESTFPLEAQEAIRNIQKVCCRDRYRGFLAVSRSWLRDTGGTAIDSVICDVLLISRNMGGLHLYTICDAADEKSMKYSKKAAQSIKKKLSENGARGQKFYVSYHVLPCGAGGEVGLPVPDDRYPKSYDLLTPREKLNEILKAMVITVAAVPSTLSSKLGVTIFNLLTTEQFRLVHQQIEVNRELWIKGVAGTGKTLVAVEFMRELRRREKLQRDEILYVCENEGIASQVRKTHLCNAICRETFINHAEFPQTKHVILDEVHNFRQRDTISWYEKARNLVRQHDSNRPGYLWCFIDICQKSHSFPSAKIFKHAKKYLVGDDSKDKVEIGHDFDGDDVRTIYYSKSEKTELDVLFTTLRQFLEEGYNERDIAVLFLKHDEIPSDDRLSAKLTGLSWRSAKDNDSENIVISSVLKYSGLERPVVVLVNVHRPLYKFHKFPFIYGAVTRAMVKLVIIRCKEG
ncbi:hypothetical protein pdam_00000211, partial [Pocillopora damicornis]